MILDGLASQSVGEFDDAFRLEMWNRASGGGRSGRVPPHGPAVGGV
jgi:hypothetical protein